MTRDNMTPRAYGRYVRTALRGIGLAIALQVGGAAAGWVGGANAAALVKADASAIQSTIQRQFEAFARDDAAAAFALASAATRSYFGDAQRFMAVVKDQYQAVYRHRNAIFQPAEQVNGVTIQSVRLTDADDRVWVAVYQLEREADGQWRIVGCQLVETKSVST